MIEFAFERLVVYREARAFRIRIYKLTRLLPGNEFKLSVQMRDAARSLTNNIAEGHGRFTYKERVRFCRDARGSLQELIDDINICNDENYAKSEHLETLRKDADKVQRLLNGYVTYLKKQALNGATTEARSKRKKINEVS